MSVAFILSSLLAAGPVAPAAGLPATDPAPSTESTRPAAEDPRRRALRVAVYSLDSTGIDERVLRVTEASFLEEIRKLQRCSVISLDEVQALLDLEAQKQLVGCTESSCLSEIAEALGADALITGGVTRVGDTVTVALKRVDPAQAAVVQTFTRQLTAVGGEELLAAIGPGVEALFPELPLRPGQERGVAPELALRLNPPPVAPMVTWSMVGVTGASAIATAGAATLLSVTSTTLQNTYENAKSTPVPTEQVLDQQGFVIGANVAVWALGGLTVAAGLTSGVLALFTDWQNLGGEP